MALHRIPSLSLPASALAFNPPAQVNSASLELTSPLWGGRPSERARAKKAGWGERSKRCATSHRLSSRPCGSTTTWRLSSNPVRGAGRRAACSCARREESRRNTRALRPAGAGLILVSFQQIGSNPQRLGELHTQLAACPPSVPLDLRDIGRACPGRFRELRLGHAAMLAKGFDRVAAIQDRCQHV